MVQKIMPSFEPSVRNKRLQRRHRMKYCTTAAGTSSATTGTTKTKTKTACSSHHVNVNYVLAQFIFLSTTIILTISSNLSSSQIRITAHAEPSHSSNTIPRSNNRYTNYNNHGQTSSSSTSSTSTTTTTTTSKSSSALSDLSSPQKPDQTYTPPWNPSPKIDSHGFLSDIYSRTPGEWEDIANIRGKHGPRNKTKYIKLLSVPVRIRQVPGDGNCLFHSIASCLHYVTTTTTSSSSSVDDDDDVRCHGHLPMDSFECFNQLRRKSLALRNSAVDVLANESTGGRRKLFLQGEEYLEARELLSAAAAQFDLEGEEYCELMRKESYWGGGPEIVALCNYLQRPIHIYELIPAEEASNSQSTDTPPFNNNDSISLANNLKMSKQFTLRRMACFGSPKYDRREPLHILSADSRFPDIEPRRIRKVGNHFLALFPVTANDVARKKGDKTGGKGGLMSDLVGNKFRRHALIRGGSRMQEGSRSGSKGPSGGSREANTNGGGNKRRGKDYSSGNDIEVSEKVLGRWNGGMGRWRTRHIVDWFV